MKKTFLILATLLCLSCSKNNTGTPANEGGQVEFTAAVENGVDEVTKASSNYELPAELIPSVSDFALKVTGSYTDPDDGTNKEYSYSYNSIYEQNELLPFMIKGSYNAAVSYGEIDAEGSDKAQFAGDADFTIIARDVINCSISASLSNSAIKLTTTEWFNKYYTDATFEVTTSLGNTFTFKVGESYPLIFVNAGTTLTLKGSAIKTTGTEVEFPANSIGTTEARSLYNIVVDAGKAGESTINISFDETTTNITPIEIELNPEV